jgi:hypothetical protein
MKNKYTLLLLTLFISFSSCKNVSSGELELNAEQTITQNDIIGVIKYSDEVYGDVYLQFQNDGICKQLSYYEGTNIWEGSWAIENNVINIVGNNVWISKINISEIIGSQIKFSIGDSADLITGEFLVDETGNKMISFSGFDNFSSPDSNVSSSNEVCNTCGINLITPTSRNCTWCNNLFDGWSPGEQDCSMLVECSDKIKKEAQEQDSDAFIAKAVLGSIEIHNGCTWRVNDNEHFCSLKCMNEYKESRY